MPRILILLLIVSFATISAVLFTPGIPELAIEFGLTDGNIQWVMSIYLLGYCFGQLPYGPIANRLGRKKALHLGFVIALLGGTIVYLSESFSVLCVGRFIQAVGAAAGLKIIFTMIADLHAGEQAAKAIAMISISFAIVFGVGVAIGGALVSAFGWRGCFAVLMVYTVFLFFCSLRLPETLKQIDPHALQIKRIAHGYARQFKDPFLVLNAIAISLSASINYIYSTVAPLLSIDVLALTPMTYGMYNLIPAVGMISGLLTARRLAGRLNPRIAILSGILLIFIGTTVMLLLFAKQHVGPWSFFLPMGLICMGAGIPWVFGSAMALSEATDKANASAVMQFIAMFGAMMGTFIVGILGAKDNIFKMPSAFGIISMISLGVWLCLRAHHRKKIR